MRRQRDLEYEYEKYRQRIQTKAWNPEWNRILEAQVAIKLNFKS